MSDSLEAGMAQKRRHSSQTLTILNGQSESDVVKVAEYRSGLIHMPGTWTAANLDFLVSTSETGTFISLRTGAGARVEITGVAASLALELPDIAGKAHYLKLRSQTADVAVNQLANRLIGIDLKG